MKRLLVALALIILMSCSETTQAPVTIGAILPQTGPIAEPGLWVRQGIDLAREEINQRGGIKGGDLNIIMEDDQCNTKTTVTAFQKLSSIDKVPLIVGPFCSGPAMAAAPLANEQKVILLSPGAGTPDYTLAGDFAFRVTPSDLNQARELSKVLSQKYKRIAVFYTNNKWGADMIKTFKEIFPNEIVAVESAAEDEKDVRTQISKIITQDPEALLTFIYPAHYASVQRQLSDLAITNLPLIGTHTFETPAVKNLGEDAKKWIYTTQAYNSNDPSTKEFIEKFKNKYGTEPAVWSAFAYDATMIAAEMLKRCGKDSECIKNELYSLKDYQGVSGVKTYDENGDIQAYFYQWKTVRDGKFVPLESS